MCLIKIRIKSTIAVFIATAFVFITYDNLQNIQAESSLPMGVTEIEMTNWTKTREPNEIGDGEKKLNSYDKVAGFNSNILDSDVESISDLYNTDTGNLREIKYLSSNIEDVVGVTDTGDNIVDETNELKKNKVLRTCNKLEGKTIHYTTNALYGYLKSDKSIDWDEQNKVTWNLYTRDDPNKKLNSVEWRMLSANVNITMEQKKLLENNNAFAVLGISADNESGFELIMPCNDVVSIFVNDKNTNINYHNRQSSSVIYTLNGQEVKFKSMLNVGNNCSNITYHNELSNHTDGYHVDMGNLSKYIVNSVPTSNLDSGVSMELDLGGSLKIGNNNIDILVGNYITDGSYNNKLCGFSKLNLYIIEKPKIEVKMMFYKYKDGKVVFFDEDYRPTKGDEVFLRFDIINRSENYELNNISFERLFNDATKQTNIIFKINENSASYGNKNITDSMRCYLNEDFSREYNLEILNSLKIGQKITLMSDDFVYSISESEAKQGYVSSYTNVSFNYVNNKLSFISNEKALRVYVSNNFGILKIKYLIEDVNNKEGDLQDVSEEKSENITNLGVNVSSDKDFANLYIQPGQTYTLNNLSITDDYYIDLIIPQDYQVVNGNFITNENSESENKVCLSESKTNDYIQSIEIKLKKKNNGYFYKNKKGGVRINIE